MYSTRYKTTRQSLLSLIAKKVSLYRSDESQASRDPHQHSAAALALEIKSRAEPSRAKPSRATSFRLTPPSHASAIAKLSLRGHLPALSVLPGHGTGGTVPARRARRISAMRRRSRLCPRRSCLSGWTVCPDRNGARVLMVSAAEPRLYLLSCHPAETKHQPAQPKTLPAEPKWDCL